MFLCTAHNRKNFRVVVLDKLSSGNDLTASYDAAEIRRHTTSRLAVSVDA